MSARPPLGPRPAWAGHGPSYMVEETWTPIMVARQMLRPVAGAFPARDGVEVLTELEAALTEAGAVVMERMYSYSSDVQTWWLAGTPWPGTVCAPVFTVDDMGIVRLDRWR